MDFAGVLFERQREALSRLLLGWGADGGEDAAGEKNGGLLSRRGCSLTGTAQDGGSGGWETLRKDPAARIRPVFPRGQGREFPMVFSEFPAAGGMAAAGGEMDGFPVDGSRSGAGGTDWRTGLPAGVLPGQARLTGMDADRGRGALEPDGLRQADSWRAAAGRQTRASFSGVENAGGSAEAERSAGIQEGRSEMDGQSLARLERSVRGAEGVPLQDVPVRQKRSLPETAAFRANGGMIPFSAEEGQAAAGTALPPVYQGRGFSSGRDRFAQDWLPVLGDVPASGGNGAQDLSRTFQRDARRYDGGFSLF